MALTTSLSSLWTPCCWWFRFCLFARWWSEEAFITTVTDTTATATTWTTITITIITVTQVLATGSVASEGKHSTVLVVGQKTRPAVAVGPSTCRRESPCTTITEVRPTARKKATESRTTNQGRTSVPLRAPSKSPTRNRLVARAQLLPASQNDDKTYVAEIQ